MNRSSHRGREDEQGRRREEMRARDRWRRKRKSRQMKRWMSLCKRTRERDRVREKKFLIQRHQEGDLDLDLRPPAHPNQLK